MSSIETTPMLSGSARNDLGIDNSTPGVTDWSWTIALNTAPGAKLIEQG